MIKSETHGNEVYIYRNGQLIMKRWKKQQYSVVFDVMAYNKHTLISYTDK